MSVFDVAGQVTARQAAERAGVAAKQRGHRAWACCPLHGEKTPSMMFDDRGGWHCFGCNQGGDAIDLYAALYGLPLLDAAYQLAADFGVAVDDSRPSPDALRARADAIRHREAVQAREADAYAALCWAWRYLREQRPAKPEDMTSTHKQLLRMSAEIGYILDNYNTRADGDKIPDWGTEVVTKVAAVKRVMDGIGRPMLGRDQHGGRG